MEKHLESYLKNEIGYSDLTGFHPKRSPREVIHEMLERGWINSAKQAWATLSKWERKGIYNYGCCLDLGWLEK